MTQNKTILNKWINYRYKLDNNILTQNHIKLALNCFKSEILNPLDDHTYL